MLRFFYLIQENYAGVGRREARMGEGGRNGRERPEREKEAGKEDKAHCPLSIYNYKDCLHLGMGQLIQSAKVILVQAKCEIHLVLSNCKSLT